MPETKEAAKVEIVGNWEPVKGLSELRQRAGRDYVFIVFDGKFIVPEGVEIVYVFVNHTGTNFISWAV